MKPAVFFDRDGTLIYDKVYLNDPQLVEFIPGAIDILQRLKQAGYLLVIVTNQSGIARGLVQVENLHKIHARMQEILKPHGVQIDDFYYSPHAADSNHATRKPNPGMLEEAIAKWNIDRSRSWMIGDKMIDVEAGYRAQTQTILVNSQDDSSSDYTPHAICTIGDVAQVILKNA